MTRDDSPGRRLPDRREFMALGIGAFVVAAVPIASRRRAGVVRRTLPMMGTVAEIAVVHRDERHAQGAIDAAFDALVRVERSMTRFDPTSDVGRANLGAAARPVRVGAETAVVIGEALRWAESSGGSFDPALGSAVALWDVTHRHEPPPRERIARLAGRRLHRQLEVGALGGATVVAFHDPDVSVDLGGIAKGYGVDRAVSALRDWGIQHALVNVGGDLYALGSSAEGDPWRIGIRSPHEPSRLAGELELTDRAVATSGDYEQFFRWRGERFHHLLDPSTGAPRRTAMHSISVVADSCMAADAGATATFGMAAPEADRLLAAMAPGARIVRLM